MRRILPRPPRLRALLGAVPAAGLLAALLASGPAGAAAGPPTSRTPPVPPTEKVVIDMVVEGKRLAFAGPESVYEGQELEVRNRTNPRRVGPHTFSLVEKGTLPKNPRATRACFTPGHICMSIARWHGFKPRTERITINPVKAGPLGWSTAGNNRGKRGDSWYTEKQGGRTIQKVTAAAGTRLWFICAVHPGMQGSIGVEPLPQEAP